MSELRVVIDTGVAVSAVLLPRSVSRRAFDAAATGCRLLASATTIAELDEVLRRPKFDKYVSEPRRLEFLAALARSVEAVAINATVVVCRDPKDDKFLELAISGNANCIVTGDHDLLVLNPFRGIAIVSPAQFLAHLAESA